MKQEILTQFPFHALSVAGLLIFFAFFAGVCIIAFHRSQKQKHLDSSLLPLQDEVLHHE